MSLPKWPVQVINVKPLELGSQWKRKFKDATFHLIHTCILSKSWKGIQKLWKIRVCLVDTSKSFCKSRCVFFAMATKGTLGNYQNFSCSTKIVVMLREIWKTAPPFWILLTQKPLGLYRIKVDLCNPKFEVTRLVLRHMR